MGRQVSTRRDWQVNATVLSGDTDNNDTTDSNKVVTTTANIRGNNSYHIISSTNVTSNTILDGFVITAGRANGALGSDCFGGGMYNSSSHPTLRNIIFSGNTAGPSEEPGHGGGMYNSSSSPKLAQVTFSGNAATGDHPIGLGGGMFNFSSSPTLTNTTFGGNTATRYGGGMGNYQNSNPRLTNVIMWGNSFLNLFNVDSTPTIAYSDCGGCGASGTGNIDADPLFVNLAGGDLRLQPTSPCIDKGNNAALPAGVTTDLDGHPRVVDGDGNGTAVVDMGAYEFQPPPPTPPHVYLPVVRK